MYKYIYKIILRYEGSFRNNKKHGSGKIYKNKAFIKDAMFYED